MGAFFPRKVLLFCEADAVLSGDGAAEGERVKILALDLGTRTGCAWNSGDRFDWAEWNLEPSRHESSGMRFVKFS